MGYGDDPVRHRRQCLVLRWPPELTPFHYGGRCVTVATASDPRAPGDWQRRQAPPGQNGRLQTTTEHGASWALYLDNGATVGFRSDGWQLWTKDLVGNYTDFLYSGTTARIGYVVDPSGRAFKFRYFTGSWQVAAVDVYPTLSGSPTTVADLRVYCPSAVGGAFACRLTHLIHYTDATGRDTTRFTYKTDALNRAMIDSVISPRRQGTALIAQRFQFDDSLHTPSGFTGPGLQNFANFRDATRRAAPRMAYGHNGQPLERLLFPNQVRGTLVDAGNHATDYQVDRFGSPTWVRRVSDGQFPGRVLHPLIRGR